MNQPSHDKDPNRPEHESSGLFSDDYEVKRENPYLKKNREKTAQAAKIAKEPKDPKEPKEPKIKKQKPVSPSARQSSPAASETDEEAGRRRTFSDFIFEHVKLLTAILTCIVILSLVIITDVTGWIEDYRIKQEQKDKTPLTLAHLRALCDRGQNILWTDMTGYARFDTDVTDDSVTWKFKVIASDYSDAELEVWISGVDTAHAPTYAYLYDLMTGERMNLNKDNLDLFLDKLEELN